MLKSFKKISHKQIYSQKLKQQNSVRTKIQLIKGKAKPTFIRITLKTFKVSFRGKLDRVKDTWQDN